MKKKKEIHIAYIIGQLTHGGAERQLFRLVHNLDKFSFKPFVFCLSENIEPYGTLLKEEGVFVLCLERKNNIEPQRVFRLAYLLIKYQIDIVHALLHIGNGYGVLAAMLAGIKTFIPSIRSEEMNRPMHIRITDWLAMRYAKAILANSERGRQVILNQWKINDEKVYVIHNGINIDHYSNKETKTHKNIRMSWIGKPTRAKNIQMMLDVAEMVYRSIQNTEFRIIGPGLSENEFELSDQYKSFVRLMGPRRDVPEILKNTDIFILTSRSEGLPNVIMEAMAAGKPVVATDVGGVSELVQHGKTGYLVPSGDVEKMTEAIMDLIEHPEKREAFGYEGRISIESYFSIEKMVRKTENLYLSIIEN
ncbi:glycosyltransferase [bacterium]|nr:glycosyltransferase [bacterium]